MTAISNIPTLTNKKLLTTHDHTGHATFDSCLPGLQTDLSMDADNLTCPLEKTPTSLSTAPDVGN